nr:hypothetical protein [Ralstonia pseudosolanacearum]
MTIDFADDNDSHWWRQAAFRAVPMCSAGDAMSARCEGLRARGDHFTGVSVPLSRCAEPSGRKMFE